MEPYVPKKIFFTTGVGVHEDELASFEFALRDAGIEKFNLSPVSSVIPPNSEFIDKKEGLELLKPGQILFIVLSRFTYKGLDEREIFASIGYAIPEDREKHGYLTEYSGFWEEKFEKYAGLVAREWVETYSRVREYGTIYRKVKTVREKYTTVVAAAVLI